VNVTSAITIVGLIALGGAAIGIVYLRRMRRRLREKPPETITCAKCGYRMEGLSMPRCPECGALRGFDVPLDKLGLSEDEVRAGFEESARRRAERGEA
jgi:hypothetical protein